jgi:cell shape-determining protein MreD
MTRARVFAAIAGILTALLLQATLVAPVTIPFPVSLPAVLVAAVALVDGPAAGMAFGFSLGLVADLGSHHPAGVLALCWLGVGLLCGLIGARRSRWRDALVIGAVGGLASSVTTVLLAVTHSGGTGADAVRYLPAAVAGDAVLGLLLIGLVRAMLHTNSLRSAAPIASELSIGPQRG